jgi:hypothetical protein
MNDRTGSNEPAVIAVNKERIGVHVSE